MSSPLDRDSGPDSDPDTGLLLQFMMPGVLHRLGNALFAMRGAVLVIDQAEMPTEASRAILEDAVGGTAQVFDLLRYVCRLDGSEVASESGALLARIFDVLRVPMRERGVRIRPDEATCNARHLVESVATTRAVCGLAYALSRAVPPGSDTTLEVSSVPDTAIAEFTFHMSPHAGCLPFPLDGAAVAARLSGWLDAAYVAQGTSHSVTLRCTRSPRI